MLRKLVYLVAAIAIGGICYFSFGLEWVFCGNRQISCAPDCVKPEGNSLVKMMNRGQEVHYRYNKIFIKSFEQLAAGVFPPETNNYRYKVVETPHGVLNYGTYKMGTKPACITKCTSGIPNFSNGGLEVGCSNKYVMCFSQQDFCEDQNYVGAVFLKKLGNSEKAFSQIVCRSSSGVVSQPIWQNGEYICGQNSERIK